MYKTIKHIASLPEGHTIKNYFFYKPESLVFITEIQYNNTYPTTLDTLIRLINSQKIVINKVKIYSQNQAYLNIQKNLDLNMNLKDSLRLAEIYKVPVLIEEMLLKSEGIRITKEMLQQSLV